MMLETHEYQCHQCKEVNAFVLEGNQHWRRDLCRKCGKESIFLFSPPVVGKPLPTLASLIVTFGKELEKSSVILLKKNIPELKNAKMADVFKMLKGVNSIAFDKIDTAEAFEIKKKLSAEGMICAIKLDY